MPVPAESLPRRTLLRESAYDRLRDAIVDGTLTPGERLRDTELEGWLGVSRTPIREALARLERSGLVRTSPGRSTVVSPLDVTAARDAQAVVAAMHRVAVAAAVPRLTAADLDAMRAANERFAAALDTGDVDAALAADDALHHVAVAVAGNTAVETVLEQFTPVLRRWERARFASRTGRDSVALHDRMIRHCADGDVDAAAAVAVETWETLGPEETNHAAQ